MLVEHLRKVERIVSRLVDAEASKSGFSKALKELGSGGPCGRSALCIFREETDSLEPVAVHGLTAAEFRKLERLADRSPLRQVLESGEAATISDPHLHPSLSPLFTSETPNSLFCCPIRPSGSVVGVLAVEVAASEFTEEARALVSLVASVFAQHFKVEESVESERLKIAEQQSHLRQELREKYDFTQIIGNSSPMRQVYDQVTQVARSNATVLLRGESGTGKEMIAQSIHYNSLRSKQPFIKVNCAALPETLIESELFGYERGAFTGADRLKKGRFELADGGTIFLDEIGDLPPQTQIKLLRVLQEREFERLGGTETIKLNVRIITATNRDLEASIADGSFREDLFYRLNVFTIFLPPLRERKSDILLLAEHFLARYEKEHGKNIKRISTPAIDMLTSYHFPGNVRELENVIERAVLVCDSNVIHGHHLPPTLQTAEVSGTEPRGSLDAAVASFETDLIIDALKSTNGNVAKAARMLESTERIIGYKIRKYGIDPGRFKQ